MKHQPARTCVGCRNVFKKDEVVRIVAGPAGTVIDYREKLPGRAAYVCPRRECIEKALTKDAISRSLHQKVKVPDVASFVSMLAMAVTEKVKSLIAMAARAGKLSAGYSAVRDAGEKGRLEMILYAKDVSDGTKEKVTGRGAASLRQATLFTKDELGQMLNRELVGVVGIEDKGLADAVFRETERLKGLIKNND